VSINDEGCINEKGEQVLKFSKHFLDRIDQFKQKGFILKEASVNFIVYWMDQDKMKEYKIILPEVIFSKENDKLDLV